MQHGHCGCNFDQKRIKSIIFTHENQNKKVLIKHFLGLFCLYYDLSNITIILNIVPCRLRSDNPVPAGRDPSERCAEGRRLHVSPGGVPPRQGGQLPNSNHVSTVKSRLKENR